MSGKHADHLDELNPNRLPTQNLRPVVQKVVLFKTCSPDQFWLPILVPGKIMTAKIGHGMAVKLVPLDNVWQPKLHGPTLL